MHFGSRMKVRSPKCNSLFFGGRPGMLSWPSESWSKVNRKYIVKKVELHFGDLTLKMQLDHYRIFTTEYLLRNTFRALFLLVTYLSLTARIIPKFVT